MKALYPQLTFTVTEYFHQKGAAVAVLTDRSLGPLVPLATVPLIVQAEGLGMFKTRCTAMAVLKALLSGMSARFPGDVSQRYAAMREVSQHLSVFMRE